MKNVALIELSESHAECIYSQVSFLVNSVNKIHLILNEKLAVQTNFTFPGINRFFIPNNFSFITRLKSYLRIKKYIQKEKIDTVIFNTTTGRFVYELLLLLPAKLNYIGTIHDGRKLVGSKTQNAISKKVKKYFALNDYVVEYIKNHNVDNVKVNTYYPIYFPNIELEKIPKQDSEFWIIIPGKVEQKRRNYFSLINHLANNKLFNSVKFILLGPSKHFNGDGKIIEEKLAASGLENNFILFDDFISDRTYFSYIKKADLIMPLVEPGNEFYETYKYSQITGAYNIAFGFGVPLFYHADLANQKDLVNYGISYSSDSITSSIMKLINNKMKLDEIRKEILREPKFQIDFQKSNYLKFLQEK